ncbi:MAG: SMC-Scp complex subunit ScpB [Mollicutes bacterium PWAP]|nr:SMC-Scp complex subunit ScpB [Mollicutes bacterium PWAP]
MNNLIEAMLYIQGDVGLTPRQLKIILKINTEDCRKKLKIFKKEFNNLQRGLMLIEAADVFKFITRPEFAEEISDFVTVEKRRVLSDAAIEVSAIVAYNQPVTKSKINAIRGKSSEAVTNTLLIKGIIEEKGIAPTPGNPVLYGVSKKFYDYFQLNSLRELPDIEQLDSTSDEEEFDLFSSQRQDDNE